MPLALRWIYRRASWTAFAQAAGLREIEADEETLETCQRLGRLVHIDDPDRLRRIRALADGRDPVSATEQREALMLGYQLEHEPRRLMAAEAVSGWLRDRPAACAELQELTRVLAERVSTLVGRSGDSEIEIDRGAADGVGTDWEAAVLDVDGHLVSSWETYLRKIESRGTTLVVDVGRQGVPDGTHVMLRKLRRR